MMVNFNWFRRRQRQQLQWQEDPNVPRRERHILSIVSSVVSCTVLIVALALKEWATADANDCNFVFALTSVIKSSTGGIDTTFGLADYYTTAQQILVSCILSISVLTILSSLVAVVISAGYPRERADFLRHYAVFNIVSLLCIVLVAGLWLAVVENLPVNGKDKDHECLGQDPVVHFGYAYYIFLAAGVFSLTAAAFNLLCGRSLADRRRAMRLWLNRQQRPSTTPRYQPVSNESPPAYTLIDTSDFTCSETETAPSDTEARSSGEEGNSPRQPPPPPIQPPPYCP